MLFGERYEAQNPLRRNGMATVYRGRDIVLDRVVAIKVIQHSADATLVASFQREAETLLALSHPNVVQIYDYGQAEEENTYFIVMELVEGTDLRHYLRARETLDAKRTGIIAHDVAMGLAAAHRRGIVHGHVKPQNILISHQGDIKLTDFGLCSAGIVQYYVPEQAQSEPIGPTADIYAFGCVMYCMLTGRVPFDGDTPVEVAMQHIHDQPTPPSQLNPTIPPTLEEIVLRCLEKVPEKRYSDGLQLAQALRAWMR